MLWATVTSQDIGLVEIGPSKYAPFCICVYPQEAVVLLKTIISVRSGPNNIQRTSDGGRGKDYTPH